MARFCYRTPQFPSEGFLGFILFIKQPHVRVFYPVMNLSRTIDDFTEHAYETLQHAENSTSIDDYAVLTPLIFKRLYTLTREFWNTPKIRYDTHARMIQFLEALKHPRFHEVLVTPAGFGSQASGEEIFNPALVYPIHGSSNHVLHFMKLSDFPVDETAKHAAIYSLGDPVGINWKTGEFIKPGTRNLEPHAN